jgi:lipopolysaccharide/colanic/teichoic acid biosynthesis glycosyltransferase
MKYSYTSSSKTTRDLNKDNQTPYEVKDLIALEKRLTDHKHRQALMQVKFLAIRVSRSWGGLAKRVIDIVVASSVLMLAMPLLIVVAFLIYATDRGPFLYWQTRVGKWGKEFRFPKFRSMKVNADKHLKDVMNANQHGEKGITFKLKKDPRITWIGKYIRKTSIDELPQLWCVIKGEMSLVGPRPALVSEVSRYTIENRKRLDITPGLTCIWQVSGRSEIAFEQQCELDVQYIEQQSVLEDIKLLLKTIPAVITGRGAY